MSRRDPAYRTFEQMKKALMEQGFKPTNLPISVAEEVCYKSAIESFSRPNIPEEEMLKTGWNGVTVQLFLSAPNTSLRHPMNYYTRHSIAVKYGATGDDPVELYGRFGRYGKPLNGDAQEIQKRVFPSLKILIS